MPIWVWCSIAFFAGMLAMLGLVALGFVAKQADEQIDRFFWHERADSLTKQLAEVRQELAFTRGAILAVNGEKTNAQVMQIVKRKMEQKQEDK